MHELKLRLDKESPVVLSSFLLIALLISYSYVTAYVRAFIAVMTIIMIIVANIWKRRTNEKNLPNFFIAISFICLVFLVVKNMDFDHGMYGRFLYTLVGFLFVLGSARTTRWIDSSIKIIYVSGIIALGVAFAGGSNSLTDLIILILLQALMAIVLTNIYFREHIFINILLLCLIYIEFILIGKLAFTLFTGCTMLVMYCIKKAESSKKKVILLLLFLVVVIVLFLYFSFTGFGKITEWMFSDDVANGRVLLFTKAIEYFKEEPIFGVGWAGFRNTFNVQQDGIYYEVHNVYLQLLCEVGIVGAIFYVSFFIINMRQSIRTLNAARAAQDIKSMKQLYFSIYLQVFFLFYGISGNFLYDLTFLLYSLAAAPPWALSRRFKNSEG